MIFSGDLLFSGLLEEVFDFLRLQDGDFDFLRVFFSGMSCLGLVDFLGFFFVALSVGSWIFTFLDFFAVGFLDFLGDGMLG